MFYSYLCKKCFSLLKQSLIKRLTIFKGFFPQQLFSLKHYYLCYYGLYTLSDLNDVIQEVHLSTGGGGKSPFDLGHTLDSSGCVNGELRVYCSSVN